jgi:hypothetical protein
MPMAPPALREHFALAAASSCERHRSPLASVVVGHALDVAMSHRQHRLRAFQRRESKVSLI